MLVAVPPLIIGKNSLLLFGVYAFHTWIVVKYSRISLYVELNKIHISFTLRLFFPLLFAGLIFFNTVVFVVQNLGR